ncbi:MAG TPA: hypothetical protein VL053_06710 [Arachidicoccus sp.]|nr:hypothetical protein [Arachidicoccus sp.]
MHRTKQWLLLSVSVFFFMKANAQINSPFSRYGIGDDYANQNTRYLGIGGMTAAFSDQQALNTSNPASYGEMRTMGALGGLATYDLGFNINSHSLKSIDPAGTYKSNNFSPAYFSMGIPLAKKGFGMVFGLKPITSINYGIKEQNSVPVSGFPDSVKNYNTVYSGSGGLNQVFVGLGKRFGHLLIGANVGYDFGKRDIKTQTAFDSSYSSGADPSTAVTRGSIKEAHTALGGFVWEGGLQYEIPLTKKVDAETKITTSSSLTIGATIGLKQDIKTKATNSFYTYYANDPDNPIGQDTIQNSSEVKGTITLPMTYKLGIMYNNYQENVDRWGVGAEYNSTSWGSDYRENGIAEPSYADSWMLRGGVYFRPSPLRGKNMFSRARYSVGFYTGKDKLTFGNNDYNTQAVTLGMGFMLRNFNRTSRQYSLVNAAFEVGRRGDNSNNVSESFMKFSLGFSLSDFWFIKRRY